MDFNSIVFFGASLSDTGNLSDLIVSPDIQGRFAAQFGGTTLFSDAVHVEYLATTLGIDVETFAIGGARAVGNRMLSEYLAERGFPNIEVAEDVDINLLGQIDRFLDQPATDLSDTAAALLIGYNDLVNIKPAATLRETLRDIRELAENIGSSVIDAAKDLADAGVGTIIYYTLPDAAFFPATLNIDLSGVDGGPVNRVTNEVLAAFENDPAFDGVTIEVVDFNRLAQEVMEDAGTFGFLADLDTSIVTRGSDGTRTIDLQGMDADQFLFWDAVHPTTAFHAILGLFTDASLQKAEHFLGEGADVVGYGAADDLVLAGRGNDQITTGDGRDIVFAGLGNDQVKGGKAGDVVSGGSGRDILYGQAGKDILAGGSGDDELRGGSARDFLVGGLGDDVLKGGKGDDTLVFVDPTLVGGTDSTDRYGGGDGDDKLYVVLDAEHYDAVMAADDVVAALKSELGLDVRGVEEIILLDSRDALHDALSGTSWETADLWGFV